MPAPSLPRAGLGLRFHYLEEFARDIPEGVDCFEVAPENYIGRGGKNLALFEVLAERVPLLAHGLTLSIGGPDALDFAYLKTLKAFLRRYKIPFFTDHLCFTGVGGAQCHELLPLPFTQAAARHAAERARAVQDFLEVPLGLENISYYPYPGSSLAGEELDFIDEVVNRAGVGLLLDVNNVLVNAINHGTDAVHALTRLSRHKILSVHVAGHVRDGETAVDTHGTAVSEDAWALLAQLATLVPLPPVIVERDNRFPALSELADEVRRAREIAERAPVAPRIAHPYAKGNSPIIPLSSGELALTDHYDALMTLCLAPAPPHRYRALVRRSITGLLTRALERTFGHMDAVFAERLVDAFLAAKAMRSRFFRDIPGEFAAFVTRAPWAEELNREKPFLLDLLDHELTRYALAFAPDGPPPAAPDPNLKLDDAILVWNPAMALKRYVYDVTDTASGDAPPRRDTRVLLVRDPVTHEIVSHALDTTSYDLTTFLTLQPASSFSRLIAAFAKKNGFSEPDGLANEAAWVLRQLLASGAVLTLTAQGAA